MLLYYKSHDITSTSKHIKQKRRSSISVMYIKCKTKHTGTV